MSEVLAEAAVRRNLERALGLALTAEEYARRGERTQAAGFDLRVRALAGVGWKDLLARERGMRDKETES